MRRRPLLAAAAAVGVLSVTLTGCVTNPSAENRLESAISAAGENFAEAAELSEDYRVGFRGDFRSDFRDDMAEAIEKWESQEVGLRLGSNSTRENLAYQVVLSESRATILARVTRNGLDLFGRPGLIGYACARFVVTADDARVERSAVPCPEWLAESYLTEGDEYLR
ncbi:hypothetical protein OVN20_05350 [Microcella daejeonensis]|uniref:hypothetical protein n=1 Tax=Microcella daejeonensis TaxID=2994971 RepID=UPI0022703230|nr:hypothetical protein [Microcella daejeonensis]WAB84978.1 hypothetical protein OVN20_05350 [Microcella daejeonensis]